MKNQLVTPRFIFISVAVLLAALSRLLPHPENFTPIAAIGLFGGALFGRRHFAMLVPLAAMVISDILLTQFRYAHLTTIPEYFTSGTIISVYISFAIIVCIGFLLRGRAKALPIIGATLGSSILFFLITNFVVWMGSVAYPANLSGLIACYAAAIPFYKPELFGSFFFNTVMGDLFYVGVMFGAYYLAQSRFPSFVEPLPVFSGKK